MGNISFTSTPDFEMPTDLGLNNRHFVDVVADDGNGGISIETISVTVVNVNEAPEITNELEIQSFEINEVENGASVDLNQLETSDPENDPLTFSLDENGQDNNLFTIVGNELVFNETPELGGDEVITYSVGVFASDDGGLNSTATTITIVVNNENDRPTISALESDDAIVVQEDEELIIAPFEGFDADGDIVTFTLSGEDQANFIISDSGQLTFNDDNRPVFQVNGDNLLEVEVQAFDGISSSLETRAILVEVIPDSSSNRPIIIPPPSIANSAAPVVTNDNDEENVVIEQPPADELTDSSGVDSLVPPTPQWLSQGAILTVFPLLLICEYAMTKYFSISRRIPYLIFRSLLRRAHN